MNIKSIIELKKLLTSLANYDLSKLESYVVQYCLSLIELREEFLGAKSGSDGVLQIIDNAILTNINGLQERGN